MLPSTLLSAAAASITVMPDILKPNKGPLPANRDIIYGNEDHIVIKYPPNTPDWVFHDTRAIIQEAGGVITQEMKSTGSFFARVGTKMIDILWEWGREHGIFVAQVRSYTEMYTAAPGNAFLRNSEEKGDGVDVPFIEVFEEPTSS